MRLREKSTRIVSVLLVIVMTLLMVPLPVIRVAATSEAQLIIDTASAIPGETIEINAALGNAPAIKSMAISDITYDTSKMTLTNVEWLCDAEIKNWNAAQGRGVLTFGENTDANGPILKMTFKVKDIVEDSEVSISCTMTLKTMDASHNEVPVSVTVVPGKAVIINKIRGDMDSNEKVNSDDAVYLLYYTLFGKEEYPLEQSGDIDGNGKTDSNDAIYLLYHVLFGGEDYPLHKVCAHSLNSFDEKNATCTEDGNSAYWYCSLCEKYFSDANGTVETTLDKTVIEAPGHNVVVDPSVAPTYDSTGLTEGSHCSVCGTTIVQQVTIPALQKEEFFITYKPDYNDAYLQTIDFNSQIPEKYTKYTKENGLYELPILEVEGYDFVGWFNGTSSSATQITEIPAGSQGDRTLYAKWEQKPFTITFDSAFVSVDNIPYYVNKNAPLPTSKEMSMTGYRWLGWSDEEGNLYDSYYPSGKKADDVVLHANWQSYRNQAVPSANAKDFKVYIDQEAKTYNFTFDLGKIKNVPLYTIADYGKMTPGSPKTTVVQTTSKALGSKEAQNIAETIAEATTKTTAWTLSNEWNKISSVSESHASEMGIDTSTIKYDFESDSSELALTSNAGESTNETVNWGVNAKIYGKNTTEVGGEAKFPIECVNVGVSAKNTTEIGGELNGYYDKTTVNDSYWNTDESFDLSKSVMSSTTSSANMSQHVSDAYNYSTTSSQGGSETSSEAVEVSQSKEREYATTIAYSTETVETVSYETEYTAEEEGWWRQIQVGTVHVIGVVTYDIATGTYSAYTYNVLDEKTTNYMDFSKTSDEYNDFETGVIPFEIPFTVNDYVSNSIGYSNDLEVDIDTGMVTGYTGDSKHVHIPDYWTTKNADGTYTATKVVGIEDGVFANNTTIETVRLGTYITSIPKNAFSGCRSLKSVEYNKIISIGDKAFANCTSLNEFVISADVTTIGADAFLNVPSVSVYAANSAIVQKATVIGSKSLSVYLNSLSDELKDTILLIPDTVNTFALYGRDNSGNAVSYSNVRIESNASTTIIDGMTFVNNNSVPLKLASKNVTLAQVNVDETSGLSIILSADSTNLYLKGKSTFSSSNATAILSKNVTISKAPETNITTSLTSSTGAWLYCGTIKDESSLFVGTKTEISAESYEQYANDSLDWVLASEAPEGATIIDEKWTYDLTTNITSDKSYVAGYTLYNTTSVWGPYGAWSAWSDGAYYASDSRQVETQQVETSRTPHYNYYHRRVSSSSVSPSYTQVQWDSGLVHLITLDYELTKVGTSSENGTPYYGYYSGCSSCPNVWYKCGTYITYTYTYKTQYRYRDRSLVYTYYHTKTEAKESATEVTASDTISNVQHWVKYVAK